VKLALNYSPQAAELLQKNEIDIDLFKCPDWDEMIATAQETRSVYVHFPLVVGNKSLDSVDWGRIENLLQSTETSYLNTHLAPRIADYSAGVDTYDVLEQIRLDVKMLADRFGADRVIIENVPYSRSEGKDAFLPLCADPGVFRKIIDETGIGFCLDLSHARITAQYLGLDERGYVASLPVQHLRELHVTGIQTIDDVPTDHVELDRHDWAAVEWAIDSIRAGRWSHPTLMTFEYGGTTEKYDWRTDPAIISEQTPRLLELARSLPTE
jgi:uncharacterized protein (UPF0276 family)